MPDQPPRSARVCIIEPADWLDAFRAAAAREKLTLSEWLGQAGLDRLPAKARKNLSSRPAAGRPKGTSASDDAA